MLAQGLHPAGRYQATWSGRSEQRALPAGMYLIRYQTPERTLVRRLMLIR